MRDSYSDLHQALYECADFPEARAAMMVRYSNDVFNLGVRDIVRQKGALSSFHIPSQTIRHLPIGPAPSEKAFGDFKGTPRLERLMNATF